MRGVDGAITIGLGCQHELARPGRQAGNIQTKDDQASDLRPKDERNSMTTRDEVARAGGVSPYTVSVVLNDPAYGRVGAATRERVQRVAEELGYQPQAAGRALRLGRTELLAYVASAQLLHEVTSYHGALVPALSRPPTRPGTTWPSWGTTVPSNCWPACVGPPGRGASTA